MFSEVDMNNDALENTANEALKGMIEASTSASSWVISELPEVVDQLLKWKFIESLAFFVIGVVLLLSAVAVMGVNARKECATPEFIASSFVYVILSGIISLSIISCNLDWLQILLAPKVYLIEYASQIL